MNARIKIGLFVSLLGVLLLAMPVAAQDFNDGRVDPRPNDRIAVYCRSAYLEVWGTRDDGTGIFLANFPYSTLVLPGPTSISTGNGQVVSDVNFEGMIDVKWFGGPYHASGFGDFAKWITCDITLYIPGGPPTGNQPYVNGSGTGTSVTASQQVDVNNGNVSVSQQVTVTTSASADCGSNHYTVQHGDNLFRIALRHGTTVSHLAACNGIANPALIYVGQQISVP